MTAFAVMFITLLTVCSYGVVGFYFLQFCKNGKTLKMRLLKWGVSIALGVVCYFFRILALGVLYLFLLLSICRLVFWIFKKIKAIKLNCSLKPIIMWIYKTGVIPLLIVGFAFGFGYYNINNVRQTSYTVSSDKLKRDYSVVFIADIHYGTVQDKDLVREKVKEINELKPDLVILGGDIVEEGTTKAEMRECFNTLKGLDSEYGTYYVYGNHDRQRYSTAPSYTEAELENAIEESNIKLLREECVSIGEDLVLLGREDLGAKSDRASREELKKQLDQNKFILTADHQPNSTEEDAFLGTDLLLSGHTHSGQIFPLGHFDFFFRGFVYGEYDVEEMKAIVSSGFAGWGFPIRTQGVSEYLTVNLKAVK